MNDGPIGNSTCSRRDATAVKENGPRAELPIATACRTARTEQDNAGPLRALRALRVGLPVVGF